MRIYNNNTRKKMNAKVDCPKSFKTVATDANISKEETIDNQVALNNVPLVRNLPNILRSNNTRNRKLNKNDSSGAEDGNTSLELNTTLSSSDLDMEIIYSKITSPKSHHQRKQVHNPLNIQYDIPDCNNNKNAFQKINQGYALDVPSNREENVPMKRLKCNNKKKKCSLSKKSNKVTVRKSNRRTQMSRKKPDTSITIPDVNVMKNAIVMQNTNNLLKTDILSQPVYDSNFPKINVNDVGTNPAELSNIFYRNEIYNMEKKRDINFDHISCEPTEIDAAQPKIIQKDITNYEFPIAHDNLQQKSMDSYIGSNFLYEPKILYSCSCANCTSQDKDIIFYEDPVSTSTSSDDMEAGLSTCLYDSCDLYTNIYDFYINNYSHIFGDSLMDLERTNFFREEFGESSFTKENTCIGSNSVTELTIENSANTSLIQNELQNLQSCQFDRTQNVRAESYPTELITYPNETIRMENAKVYGTDIPHYLNLGSFSMKQNKVTSQAETLIQNDISSDVPISNSTCQILENKRDFCVIKCSQCGKLFNKKHQLWKHFIHCNFYKKDFKCHICNKIYRHKSSLAHHLRIVHNVSHNLDEKLYYTCKKCSKLYVRFRAFQRHVLLHDD